jgi:pyridoxine/pyridoxamine 5'-phosphate oxidase
MELKQAFKRMMAEQKILSLATSVDNIPNVRIVNFIYNPDKIGVVYFSTFKGNQKEKEFLINNQVAFTTIPSSGNEHVRAGNATIQKSELSIYELQDAFARKIADYKETIQQVGEHLVVYEIHFSEVSVTIDITHSGIITL